MARFSLIPAVDTGEFADDIRRMLDEVAASLRPDQRALSGECRPAVDVLEFARHVEIIVDLAGIPPAAVRIAFREGILLVVGEKAPPLGSQDQTFHLVEREFGRFARAVRLTGAFDVANARAWLRDGELSVTLPRIAERRGQTHDIRLSDGPPHRP